MGSRPDARPANQPFHAGSVCGNGLNAPRAGTVHRHLGGRRQADAETPDEQRTRPVGQVRSSREHPSS